MKDIHCTFFLTLLLVQAFHSILNTNVSTARQRAG